MNENSTPTEVLVPVELLKRAAINLPTGPVRVELADLIPKPRPRIVAVDLDWVDGMASVDLPAHLDRLPNLLDQLDNVIGGATHTRGTQWRLGPEAFKAAYRAKLGVPNE